MGRIVIVDDDYSILKYCEAVLNEAGHEAVIFSDPDRALNLLKLHPADLTILDILMPQMDGYDFLNELKTMPPESKPPVLMLTRKRAPDDVRKAIQHGAMDYVCKPIDRDVLLSKVGSILGHIKSSKGLQFAEGSTYSKAEISVDTLVTSITEMGVTILTRNRLDRNLKITINSVLLNEIGLTNPFLRVIHCTPLEKETEYRYSVQLSFIGLDELSMQKIRKWITQRGIALRKAG